MATTHITISIEIMHDKNLNANQKFLLAEISQLSTLERGCYASNKHFSDLIGITKVNVSKNIKALAEMGYINSEIKAGSRNHVRIITLIETTTPPYRNDNTPLIKTITPLIKTITPPYQNDKTPLSKRQETKENIHSNIQENIQENKKRRDKSLVVDDFADTKKENAIATVSPTKEKQMIQECDLKSVPSELVEEFVNYRKKSLRKPYKTARGVQGLINILDKLESVEAMKIEVNAAIDNEWQKPYPQQAKNQLKTKVNGTSFNDAADRASKLFGAQA